MPNVGKRRFRYFEEGYLNKWINIAAFNRAKTGAFSAVIRLPVNKSVASFDIFSPNITVFSNLFLS